MFGKTFARFLVFTLPMAANVGLAQARAPHLTIQADQQV